MKISLPSFDKRMGLKLGIHISLKDNMSARACVYERERERSEAHPAFYSVRTGNFTRD